MKRALVKGGVFLKHGKRGSPHRRYVWVSGALDAVLWKALTRGSKTKKAIPTSDLLSVETGHATAVLGRKGVAKHSSADRCFSLVAKGRTLDLEADSEATRDQWVAAFEWLVRSQNPQQ